MPEDEMTKAKKKKQSANYETFWKEILKSAGAVSKVIKSDRFSCDSSKQIGWTGASIILDYLCPYIRSSNKQNKGAGGDK